MSDCSLPGGHVDTYLRSLETVVCGMWCTGIFINSYLCTYSIYWYVYCTSVLAVCGLYICT